MSASQVPATSSGDIQIALVTSTGDRREFVELPYQLYRGHPHWVPPLRRDEYRRLSPKHNPFFEHASMTLWVARRNGRAVGRIAAMEDRLHDEKHQEQITWFGFFEAEDRAVADALFATVDAQARQRGRAVVRGPANPSLNETAGLLVDSFDLDPYILMPYNPPSYVQFVERAGYVKAKDLLAWDLDMTKPMGERISRVAERVARRHGVVIRPLDLTQFDRDLGILRDIYRAAWEDNWGFVPPTDAEIRQLAVDLKPVLEPRFVLYAEINGRPVGVAVAIPDINQVLKRMNGNLLPFGLVHFLRRRSIVTRVRVALMGVVPEVRKIGLYPLLIAELHNVVRGMGLTRAELSWTLEDNDAVNAGIEAVGGIRHKTYRLYEKRL